MDNDNQVSLGLKPDVPTSEEFTQTMGQVCWLMSQSAEHKSKPISLIEAHVAAPLMFKQVRMFSIKKQPLAAILWAYASPEVRSKLDVGDYTMSLQDWRSGKRVVVVDCISPFMDGQRFIDEFMAQADAAIQSQNNQAN